MNSVKQNISTSLFNIISHHKIFSSIQKLAIFFALTVVLSWLLGLFSVTLILVVSVSFSFLTCHLLASINRNYNAVKVLLVFYKSHSKEISLAIQTVNFFKRLLSKIIWDKEEEEQTIESTERHGLSNDERQNDENSVTVSREVGQLKVEKGCETLLQDEIACITGLIIQDFIRPWYCVREQKEEIIEESRIILHEGIKHFFSNLANINIQELARDILLCYQEHLSMFQIARMTYRTQPKRRRSPFKRVEQQSRVVNPASKKIASIEEAFEMKFSYHSAVWGTEYECNYVKSLTHLLVLRLLEEHVKGCKTTRLMLVEILSCNVLMPLVELISNADFLHESMIIILSDETPVEINDDLDDENDDADISSNDVIAEGSISSLEESDLVASMKDSTNKSKTDTNEAGSNQNELEGTNMSCSGLHVVGFRTETSLEVNKQQVKENTSNKTPSESDVIPRDTAEVTNDERILDEPEFSVIPAALLSPAKPCVRSLEVTLDVKKKLKDSTKARSESPETKNKDDSNQTHVHSKSPRKRKGEEFVSGVELGEEAGAQVQSKEVRGGSQDSQGSWSKVTFALDSGSYENIEEHKVEDPTELIFQDVNIIDTETATESRSSTQYTLYVIEYAAWYTADDSVRKLHTQTVKRRFREFVNLQGRLEDNLSYKNSLKDTKGPKRWISLPFGNMDKSSVENRKNRLETYLKALIVKPDVSNGQELKEFLGYEGDGHIAFVRKAPENTLPRIDKMLIRSVSGVIDKIGGKMDELTTRASEVLPSFTGRKDVSSWTPSGPYDKDEDNIPLEFGFLKNETWPIEADLEEFAAELDKEQAELSCTDGESVSGEKGVNDQTDSFTMITGQSVKSVQQTHPSAEGEQGKGDRNEQTLHGKLTNMDNDGLEHENYQDPEDNPSASGKTSSATNEDPKALSDPSVMDTNLVSSKDDDLEDKTKENKDVDVSNEKGKGLEKENEAVLADAALNVGVQALQGRDCWLCRDRVVSLTKHLTATALHHWLETEINELVSEERCLQYIRKLREVIWPGGVFDSSSHRIRSDKQKMATKTQARKCLAEFLPNFVRGSMDQGDYSAAIDEIIDSLQHEKLNKNFIYTVLDLVIERTFPEISTKDIQDQLIQ